MARIRTIKPEFFTSDTVAELSLRARLTWIGLWTYCDDFGRCRDNVKLIKAAVWALDDVSLTNIEKDLTDLLACGLVYRYDVAGKSYLQITNWEEHQRVSHPTASKIPEPDLGPDGPPPGTRESTEDSGAAPEGSGADRDSSGAAPLGTWNREKEQGRGKEKTSAQAAPAQRELFDTFWHVYPRRVDKRAAERAWRAALKRGAVPEVVIGAAHVYAEAKIGTDPKFIKHPATWLNAEAYDNEPEPVVPWVNRQRSRAESGLELASRWEAEDNSSIPCPRALGGTA